MKGSKLQDACRERIDEELSKIADERSKGVMTAGYICSGFPAAVAAGLGLRPLRIVQGIPSSQWIASNSKMRPDVCPFILSVLEASSSGSGTCGLVDVWVGAATCDQTRRLFASMAGVRPVHNLQLPSTRTGESLRYYQWQVTDMVERMQDALGLQYSEDRAMEYAGGIQEAGTFLSELAGGGTILPMDLHMLIHLALLSGPDGLLETIEGLAGLAQDFIPSKRIALAGSMLALEDTLMLEVLQENQVAAVPLGCTGLGSLPFLGLNRLPASGSPADIAAESFRSSRCIRCRPNDDTFRYLVAGIKETRCSGLIVKTLKFCDLWYAERERFRNRMEVPVLVMDTSYGEGEALRQANRLEAFLETVPT